MTEATALILKQWGAFGAVLVVLVTVIWKLWTDATAITKSTIDTLATSNKDLTAQLAESNRLRIADHATMTAQLVEMTKDNAGGQANATNAIEAVGVALADTKLAMRDLTEETRRGRGG